MRCLFLLLSLYTLLPSLPQQREGFALFSVTFATDAKFAANQRFRTVGEVCHQIGWARTADDRAEPGRIASHMQRGGTVDQRFGLVVVAAVVVTAVILAVVLMFLGGYVVV